MSSLHAVVLVQMAQQEFQKAMTANLPWLKEKVALLTFPNLKSKIIAEKLPLQNANDLKQLLSAQGIPAEVIEQEELDVPVPHHVHLVNMEPTRLCYSNQLAQKNYEFLPWTEISMFFLTSIKDENLKKIRDSENTVNSRGHLEVKDSEHAITVEEQIQLEILAKRQKIRLQINPKSLNYSFLKERRALSSDINFHIFVSDLRNRAPQAIANLNFSNFCEKKTQPPPYSSKNASERELRWFWWFCARVSPVE